jgi:mannose-6-phosphate isomerase-like protein (cupin superfamily)
MRLWWRPAGDIGSATSSSWLARSTRRGSRSGFIEIAPGRQLDEHVHSAEDDAFYILHGEMTFTLGDEEIAAPPGTFVLVPPGVAHGFRNAGEAPVRMLNIHAPAGFDQRIGLPPEH